MTMRPGSKASEAARSGQNWTQWKLVRGLLEYFQIIDSGDRPPPVYGKKEKVPHLSAPSVHRWLIFHAFAPAPFHQLYIYLAGQNLGPIAAATLYTLTHTSSALSLQRKVKVLGNTYGYFDGDQHGRNRAPHSGVGSLLIMVFLAAALRPIMLVCLLYDSTTSPLSIDWIWLPIKIGLYLIILDFWYYSYHRLMHEIHGLWKYHRTHHLIKHPTMLYAVHSGIEQVCTDLAAMPAMTFFTMRLIGLPLGFYEWYICIIYSGAGELFGHSGCRLHAPAPNPLCWLLEIFDVELILEDHDLHHRHSGRKNFNYGKQTRIWDRLFNTCGERIETVKENVDYDRAVWLPIP